MVKQVIQLEKEDADSSGGDDTGTFTRVFVYGTLKKGFGNHHLLAGCEYLGPCTLGDNYAMVSLGWFPGVVSNDNVVGTIQGEVYRIPEEVLFSLDILEGHPDFYKRERVPVTYGDNVQKNAWIYLLNGAYLDSGMGRIANGNWTGA